MLAFILFVGIIPNGKVLAEEIIKDENIEVIENNTNKIEVQTEVETTKGDATVSATWNKNNDTFTVTSIEKDSNGNDIKKEYKVDIEEATEDNFKAVFTDIKTNEKFHVNSNEAHASIVFLLPIAGIIGQGLVSHLIAIGAAIVIAGSTYVAVSKVASQLKRKQPEHYAATIRRGDLYVGGSLSYSSAVSRLKGGSDIWSKNSNLAFKVAQGAGKGKRPTNYERHGQQGYYWHYHTWNRSGGHSFFHF